MELAKIIEGVGPVKAPIRYQSTLGRLEAAVKSFKETLDVAQRKDFEASIPKKTGPHDVAALLAEIEHVLRKKTKRKSAIGAKLRSVATAVHQFAAVGDLLIPLSPEPIVRGVWFAFRMALLAATFIESTMQELSQLFMAVGKTAPIYDNLILLYRESPRLQNALFEYYIIILDLCEVLIKHSKSSLRVLWSKEKGKDYFEEELNKNGQIIRLEIKLAMATDIKSVVATNKKTSGWIKKMDASQIEYQKEMAKQRILDALSDHNYRAIYQQQRKMGNTDLYESQDSYQEWLAAGGGLIITGKLGYGKTVLVANMIETLENTKMNGSSFKIAYFFCRFGDSKSLEAKHILGCLAKQLLMAVTNGLDWTGLARTLELPLGNDDIVRLLSTLPAGRKYVIILDGLYECPLNEWREVTRALANARLTAEYDLSVVVTSRSKLDSDLRWISNDNNFKSQTWTMDLPKDNPDIVNYIDVQLRTRYEDGRLVLMDPYLMQEIIEKLMNDADDMFLWVVLMVDCLCLQTSDFGIRLTLRFLPSEISELIQQILVTAKLKASNDIDQDRLLQIIVGATRLLTESEIAEALSVDPSRKQWDPSRLPNDTRRMLTCCSGLVVVDEEDKTVRFIHHTIEQYLLNSPSFARSATDRILAEIIITYLGYDITDSSIVQPTVATVNSASARGKQIPRAVIRSTLGTSNRKQVVCRILDSISRGTTRTETSSLPLSVSYAVSIPAVYHLVDYAYENLLHHSLTLLGDRNDGLFQALGDLLEGRNDLQTKVLGGKMEMGAYQPFSWKDHTWKLLLIALVCRRTGSESFVKRVLDHGPYEQKALDFACQSGNEELINAVIEQWHRYFIAPVPGMVLAVSRILNNDFVQYDVQYSSLYGGPVTERNKQILEMLFRVQESMMPWYTFEWLAGELPRWFRDIVAKCVVLQPPRYLALAVVLNFDLLDVLKMNHFCKATNNYSLSIPVHHRMYNLSMDMTLFDYLLTSQISSRLKIQHSRCHNFLSERQARSVIDDIDVFDNDLKDEFRERFLLRAIWDGNSSRLEQALAACKRAPYYHREDWMALLRIPLMDKLLKSRQSTQKAVQHLVETTPKRADNLPKLSFGRSRWYIPEDLETWLLK